MPSLWVALATWLALSAVASAAYVIVGVRLDEVRRSGPGAEDLVSLLEQPSGMPPRHWG